jgi:hypothetical protein
MSVEFNEFEPSWYDFYADYEDFIVEGEINIDLHVQITKAYYIDEDGTEEASDVERYIVNNIKDEFLEYLNDKQR